MHSAVFVIIFNRRNKYLFKSRYFNCIQKNINLHKNPQSDNDKQRIERKLIFNDIAFLKTKETKERKY